MKTAWMCIGLAALAAGVVAQEEKKSGEQKVVFDKKSFPFEGEVGAERLNVRMFPKTDQTSIISSILTLGEKITVVGERDDFYQILPPKGCTAWISGKSVKREGAGAVVTVDGAPVRLDSRMTADAVCTLKEGDAVKIVSEHMGWLKIESPVSVKYFVGKKYVRPGRDLDVTTLPFEIAKAAPPKPGADAEARLMIAEADALMEEQTRLVNAQKLDEVDFAAVVTAYESAAAAASSGAVKSEAERGLKRYRELQIIWSSIKADKAAKESRLQALREELDRKPVEEKTWAMSGYMDTTGMLWKRPGTHKLVMGGRIVCFLRIEEGNDTMTARLNDLFGKYVGVDGVVIKNPDGWDGYSVVVVRDVVAIDRKE